MAFTTINAEVENVFYDGKGVRIFEAFVPTQGARAGEEVKIRWTAWFEEAPALKVGDKGRFNGRHGDKVDEYEGKHRVDRSINGASYTPEDGEF